MCHNIVFYLVCHLSCDVYGISYLTGGVCYHIEAFYFQQPNLLLISIIGSHFCLASSHHKLLFVFFWDFLVLWVFLLFNL
jgi:hypothetical protein